MANELSDQITYVIDQVHHAVRQAGLEASGLKVTSIDLTLTSVLTSSAGLDLKFKLFGHDVGFTLGGTGVSTQTIDLTLAPAAERVDGLAVDLAGRLADAIGMIRDAVAAAAMSDPSLGLSQATVQIDFELDFEGNIDIILTADVKKSATQSLKLTLGPA